jgi:hypothetical protein
MIEGAFDERIDLGDSLFFRTMEELLLDSIAENLFSPLEFTKSLSLEGSKLSSIFEFCEILLGFWLSIGTSKF